MKLLNDLIAILAIKILFVEVNIWHVNTIMFVDFVPKFHFEKNLTEIFESKCNERYFYICYCALSKIIFYKNYVSVYKI